MSYGYRYSYRGGAVRAGGASFAPGFAGAMASALVDPDTALALDFKGGQYRQGLTTTTTLSSLSGYTYAPQNISFGQILGSCAIDEVMPDGSVHNFASGVPAIVPDWGISFNRAIFNTFINPKAPANQTRQMQTGGQANFVVMAVGPEGSGATVSIPGGSTLVTNRTLPGTAQAKPSGSVLTVPFFNGSTERQVWKYEPSAANIGVTTTTTGDAQFNLVGSPAEVYVQSTVNATTAGADTRRVISVNTSNTQRGADRLGVNCTASLPLTVGCEVTTRQVGGSTRTLWAFASGSGSAPNYSCTVNFSGAQARIQVITPGGTVTYNPVAPTSMLLDGHKFSVVVTITDSVVRVCVGSISILSTGIPTVTNYDAQEFAVVNSAAPAAMFFPFGSNLNAQSTTIAIGSGFFAQNKALTLEELESKAHYPIFTRSILPMSLGMNEGFTNVFIAHEKFRDNAVGTDWRNPADNSVIPLQDLSPTTGHPLAYPAGQTELWGAIWGADVEALDTDEYTINYDPGMTLALRGTQKNITVVSGPAAGEMKVRRTTAGAATVFAFTMSGTIPAGGVQLTCIKTSELASSNQAGTRLVSDYNQIGAGVMRFMSAQGTNTTLPFSLTSSRLSWKAKDTSLEYMVAACNEANKDLWLCEHHQADATWVPAAAAYVFANLNPNLKVYLEWSNETWNSFFPVYVFSRLEGAKAGYWNTLGDAPPIASFIQPSNTDIDPVTGNPNVTYTAGDRIFFNRFGFGIQVYEAKINTITGAGATLPQNGENTYWRVLIPFASIERGARRYQAQRSLDLFDAFEAAFGGTSRLRRVMSGHTVTDTITSIMERLDWNDAYLKTDGFAFAPYWYPQNFLNGTEAALINTDTAAYVDALYAHATEAIDDITLKAKGLYDTLENTLRSEPYNRPANSIVPMSYECNHHYTAPQTANGYAAFAAFRADPRFETATREYLQKLQSRVGGLHMLFDHVIAAVNSTTWQGWGFRYKQGGTAPGLSGLLDFVSNDL